MWGSSGVAEPHSMIDYTALAILEVKEGFVRQVWSTRVDVVLMHAW